MTLSPKEISHLMMLTGALHDVAEKTFDGTSKRKLKEIITKYQEILEPFAPPVIQIEN